MVRSSFWMSYVKRIDRAWGMMIVRSGDLLFLWWCWLVLKVASDQLMIGLESLLPSLDLTYSSPISEFSHRGHDWIPWFLRITSIVLLTLHSRLLLTIVLANHPSRYALLLPPLGYSCHLSHSILYRLCLHQQILISPQILYSRQNSISCTMVESYASGNLRRNGSTWTLNDWSDSLWPSLSIGFLLLLLLPPSPSNPWFDLVNTHGTGFQKQVRREMPQIYGQSFTESTSSSACKDESGW